MEKNGRIIELRDRNGGLILSFLITEKSLNEPPKNIKNNPSDPKRNENPLAQDALMTDAQKRFLFRILSDQGKEGEEAHEYLKNKIFQVNSLEEVTKLEASQAIERLLAEQKGGAGK
jgi:hypothetical protein